MRKVFKFMFWVVVVSVIERYIATKWLFPYIGFTEPPQNTAAFLFYDFPTLVYGYACARIWAILE